jgi:hypothetical protein
MAEIEKFIGDYIQQQYLLFCTNDNWKMPKFGK